LSRICTAVAIGFYIRDETDFLVFSSQIKAISKMENSVFSVYETSPHADYGYEEPSHIDENEDGFELI
jgi:hypothetical protein